MKKKLLALTLVGMMAISGCTSAFAADSTVESAEMLELNWSDMEAAITDAGWEGEFQTFDEIAIQIWIPSALPAAELTEEDRENGYIGYFTDDTYTVSVTYTDMEAMDLDTYAEEVAAVDGVSNVQTVLINGLPFVAYDMEEADTTVISTTTEMGYVLEICCAPISDEDFIGVISAIFCSVQATEDVEESAVEEAE